MRVAPDATGNGENMARRRKGRRGHKKGAIPIVQTAILAYPALTAYNSVGISKELPANLAYQFTGIDVKTGKWVDPMKGVGLALVLVGTSTIGKKVANRVGANRMMRKLTGNLVQLM